VNTDELDDALYGAELRVLKIQAKLHRWARMSPTGLVERPVPGDRHAGCGKRPGETGRSTRPEPRPGPTSPSTASHPHPNGDASAVAALAFAGEARAADVT
jgi:hypothetical protein